MFTAQGCKCCVLEGSPRYRGGTVMQFAQVRLVYFIAAAVQLGVGVSAPYRQLHLQAIHFCWQCKIALGQLIS